jgi:RND family efflux transporter MFP subunit
METNEMIQAYFLRNLLVLLVFLVLPGTGCRNNQHDQASSELTSVAVKTVPAEMRTRRSYEEVVGTVQPKIRSVISAKVSGKVEKLNVAPGQEVKAGEVMIELEAADIRAKLEQAQALYRQAENDLRRSAKLLPQNAVTQADYDNTASRAAVTKASVAEASTMLSYAMIAAPFDGVVAKKYVDIGDFAAPGVPLLEIQSLGTLRFEAEIPEAVISKITAGDKLMVRVAYLAARSEGTVSEIVPAADPNSRTFLIKLDLPPVEGLMPGQFGRVQVPTGQVSSVQIPSAALLRRGQMELVFVVKDNKVNLRLVKSGKTVDNNVEILSGLDAGEVVVAQDAGMLVDQQPVSTKG